MKKNSKQFMVLYKKALAKHPKLRACPKAGHFLTPQNVFGGASLKRGLLHCIECDRTRKGVKARVAKKSPKR
jgi:hypothetical protein